MIRMSVSTAAGIVLLAVLSYGQQKHMVVKVSNPSDRTRSNETITVPRDTLMSDLVLRGSEPLVVTDAATGKELAAQWVDNDLNGVPDEFIFQSNFKARESKSFLVSVSSKARKATASMVDVRYVEPREDVAWENDHIAFRVYGPALAAEVNNGIDVWTKRVRSLIVKKWYEGEEQTPKIVYHIDHGEGADFFNVGKSLGCGGNGIWYGGKVYQPGVFSSYKIIAAGPIRTRFELRYKNWNVEGTLFREVERITLDAGQNLNRIELTFKGGWEYKSIALACGLVKRDSVKMYRQEDGDWMSLWGPTNDNPENGFLGTGVVFLPKKISGWAQDSSQYIAIGDAERGSTFTYYAGAGWTRSGDFQSVEDWNNYLKQFADNLNSPLQVTFEVKK